MYGIFLGQFMKLICAARDVILRPGNRKRNAITQVYGED